MMDVDNDDDDGSGHGCNVCVSFDVVVNTAVTGTTNTVKIMNCG